MASLPKTYKAAVFQKANEDLTIIDTELKLPGAGEVLVKVLAVGAYFILKFSNWLTLPGVCHSDSMVQAGLTGNAFPIVPGHEIIGNVVAIGDGEKKWKVGERVGGPWHGGMWSRLDAEEQKHS
jgi:D-arabinose 1-dehydrogenase-like Zn-dependent alcohol dehydrogenase